MASGNDPTVYDVLRREIELRITLQNKCVELSVLLTSGLAVTLVAGLFNVQARVNEDLLAAGILAITLYILLQCMLLGNYLCHSYYTLRVRSFIRDHSVALADDLSGIVVGAFENAQYHADDDGVTGTWLGTVICRMQPIVIYGSTCLAIVVAVSLLSSVDSDKLTFDPWPFWLLLGIDGVTFIALAGIHVAAVVSAQKKQQVKRLRTR